MINDEEHFRKTNVRRFCEKEINFNEVRDHCRLIGKNGGPAHNICIINVKPKQSIFTPFVFQNFSIYDYHLILQKLVGVRIVKVNFDTVPKSNEECFSVTYGSFRLIDSYRFLSSSLVSLVKTLVQYDHKPPE